MGDLAVELTAVRLLLGLQVRVDVVGVVFVGLGGGTVLGRGVERLTLVVLRRIWTEEWCCLFAG